MNLLNNSILDIFSILYETKYKFNEASAYKNSIFY